MNDAGFGFSSDECVIVTGAASGIGRATALRAVREGLGVIAWDVNDAGLKSLTSDVQGAHGRILTSRADVTDDDDVERSLREAIAFGRCPFLVNNAGPPSSSDGAFSSLVEAAVGSVDRVTTAWIAAVGDQASAIVNVSSVAGTFSGGGTRDFYPAAKAAIAGYSRHLAVTLKGQPRVNCVAPGFTHTPRTAAYLGLEHVQRALAHHPMGRAAQADEQAAVICFLLSPAASFVNGAMIPVDGGAWLVA